MQIYRKDTKSRDCTSFMSKDRRLSNYGSVADRRAVYLAGTCRSVGRGGALATSYQISSFCNKSNPACRSDEAVRLCKSTGSSAEQQMGCLAGLFNIKGAFSIAR